MTTLDQLPDQINIAQTFLADRLAEGRGGRTALRLDDHEMTYTEVEALASGYAEALVDCGVRREERVVILDRDGPHFVGALFGTLKLGAVGVMVNPDLPRRRIAEILELARPGAVVAGHDVSAKAAAAMSDAGTAHPLIDTFSDTVTHTASFPCAPTHRDDPALWLFSGGSTGVPKAVVQTHGSFLNTTLRYAHETMGYHEDDVTLAIPKLYFGYATGANLFFPFSVGAAAALFPEHPTVEVVLDRIARHRPTIMINVPTMIGKLLAHEASATAILSSLRFATSAGEALPVELYERWTAAYGVPLYDGLGTAEMWHVFLTNRPGSVTPGTLGTPVRGFDVRVRDAQGNDLPDGEVGELWVRGRSRGWGYWQNLPKTAETFRGEWVVTGDLIRRRDDGSIEHHGRADDSLKVSGKWLAPQEVESCLLAHDEVRECVVVGVPDAAGLVKPVAFVIPTEDRPGLAAELKAHALDRLDPYKHPRRIVIVERFPQTHLGKVDRRALAASHPADPA
ncbi:MAG TPA: benzoate-CoA ligase family protein [Acidimicrobiia bacterium]|jgi:benzoate-CoA ligase family protein|nr:benzoate-CoA ligase family protein [Acidimicrobiia bacterium]